MTEHKVFNDLASIVLENFKDKPTSLTAGQQEASSILWTSADGHCKIGVIKGRATVTRVDGEAPREIKAGDLLVLPQGWKGNG